MNVFYKHQHPYGFTLRRKVVKVFHKQEQQNNSPNNKIRQP